MHILWEEGFLPVKSHHLLLGTHLPLCRLQVELLPAGGLEISCRGSHLDPSRSFHYQGPGWWFQPKAKTKQSIIVKIKINYDELKDKIRQLKTKKQVGIHENPCYCQKKGGPKMMFKMVFDYFIYFLALSIKLFVGNNY